MRGKRCIPCLAYVSIYQLHGLQVSASDPVVAGVGAATGLGNTAINVVCRGTTLAIRAGPSVADPDPECAYQAGCGVAVPIMAAHATRAVHVHEGSDAAAAAALNLIHLTTVGFAPALPRQSTVKVNVAGPTATERINADCGDAGIIVLHNSAIGNASLDAVGVVRY